ncbi:MAG: zinc-binding dehydrogenase [Acidobacteriia bacterium]|nr:zinc-binding dehydrogenase [Terriglobia bacterium]
MGSRTARLEAATRVGAAAVVSVGEGNLLEIVKEHTGGRGVDVTFECAGHPDSVHRCLGALRPMGRYTQVAISGREIHQRHNLALRLDGEGALL